jgi:3'(2'), 5'-bisphosphate nucleotidase
MQLDEHLLKAMQAALEAGEAILGIYEKDFEVETKSDNSPLTAADKASHAIIVAALNETPFPVLSEESAEVTYEDRREWATYWLVDPLDGTKEFIKKNGEFTVNIALIEDEVPVAGVVYVPVLDVLYWGQLAEGMEHGAWRCEECRAKTLPEIKATAAPCTVRHAPSGTPLRVVASKSHCNDETREFIAELEELHGAAERVSRGSSLKLCMVAEGSADLYPRIAPTMEWDTAAAHAIVVAAGGAVFEYDSELPVEAYVAQGAEGIAQGNDEASASRHVPRALRYNKENLLNPYFVVSGLRK